MRPRRRTALECRRSGWMATALLALVVLAACRDGRVKQEPVKKAMLSDSEISSLQAKRIFFGHKSVGDNILDGIRDLAAADARLRALSIVRSSTPEAVEGPALVECHIGKNGDPGSKNAAFAGILERGAGVRGGIAVLKYCYADIAAATDVDKMFAAYRETISAIQARHPRLRIVHVTIPLTTVEPWGKAFLKSLAGKVTARDLCVKRNLFNRRLREAYAKTEPVFDLAEAESTRMDGSRASFRHGDESVFTMSPEHTTDGGHLNQAGRAAAALSFLRALAACNVDETGAQPPGAAREGDD